MELDLVMELDLGIEPDLMLPMLPMPLPMLLLIPPVPLV